MKLFFMLFLLFPFLANAQCPDYGSSKNKSDSIFNTYKNRSVHVGKKRAKLIPIDSILKDGRDSARFNNNMFVCTEGYVIAYKAGGSEQCNCNSEDPATFDMHIEIGKTPDAPANERMIVELTPKLRKERGVFMTLSQVKTKDTLSYGFDKKDLKNMVGHKIKVTGYFFFDKEHAHNAKNSCHSCSKVWRKTCWEIHPVTKLIQVN